MGLIDLQTDLKSLKYGKDRFGQGNSGQPYIKTPIPDNSSSQAKDKDFILRGGMNAPKDAIKDVVRLTKYFTDLKSPSGMLFIAKQNLLSRTGVATQASGKEDWKNAPLNEGAYTPLSTLGQALGGFSGLHLDKQGINPIKGIKTYTDVKNIVVGSMTGEGNRLVDFYNTTISTTNLSSTLYSYSGGPNSPLGIGKTNIPIIPSEQRTGINNPKIKNSGFFPVPIPPDVDPLDFVTSDPGILGSPNRGFNPNYDDVPPPPPKSGFGVFKAKNVELDKNKILFLNDNTVTNIYNPGGGVKMWNGLNRSKSASSFLLNSNSVYTPGTLNPRSDLNTYQIGKVNSTGEFSNFYNPLNNTGTFGLNSVVGVSYKFNSIFPGTSINENLNSGNDGKFGRSFETNVYIDSNLNNSKRINDNNTLTLTQKELEEQLQDKPNKSNPGSEIQDFREYLTEKDGSKTIMSTAPLYNSKWVIDNKSGENRIRYTSPGQKGNIKDYSAGKIVNGNESTVDRINALPIYQSSNVKEDTEDLIKFRIAAINTQDPTKFQYVHFRAYIDSFSDAYTGNWEGTKYMGRGEQFYKYSGFDRKINLGFTVAAQSKPELIAQYKKLNFLASNLAPTYSPQGYMGGPLIRLTIGGWCYELPGFISSMTLDVPSESPWEIGIGDGVIDETVKQLPHIVKVTGFSFTPIHTFRPEKQVNNYGGEPEGEGFVDKYGPQRYLALENESGNNYD